MTKTMLVVTQNVSATPELLYAELKKQELDIYPMDVLKAYLERYAEWEQPVVITPQMVNEEIKASPFSYCPHNKMYLFEGQYYPTIDAITDYVVDNHYGLITDEKSQIVYYIICE